jgi:serine protease
MSSFQKLKEKGTLTFAAAGSYGDSEFWYPASYSFIIVVAAINSINNRAEFSHCNSQVDISAPGTHNLHIIRYDTILL